MYISPKIQFGCWTMLIVDNVLFIFQFARTPWSQETQTQMRAAKVKKKELRPDAPTCSLQYIEHDRLLIQPSLVLFQSVTTVPRLY